MRLCLMTALIVGLSLMQSTWAASPKMRMLPHLDLEMQGYEYEELLKSRQLGQPMDSEFVQHQFDDIFATGKRNLDWIQILNANRSQRLSLSTPETQQGFPIEKPRIYNPEIIRNEYNNLKKSLPSPLNKIIFGTAELPTELPCTDAEYLKWGLAVDHIYQIAARWRTYEPYMSYLRENAARDIRGYYYITTTEGLLNRMKDWSSLAPEDQSKILNWLIQVCVNDLNDRGECSALAQQATADNAALVFFEKHRSASEGIIQEMMVIPSDGHFRAVIWINENSLNVPFIDPDSEAMRSYLRDNLQEEWQLNPFNLNLSFVSEFDNGVRVIWSPGVTPHVPSLGSDTIYMDANAPISEYDVQWTIRHEFGHVLGFPDCYIEFYDSSLEAIVGYQLDTTDLMCSRRGHLKARHVDELRRAYLPNKSVEMRPFKFKVSSVFRNVLHNVKSK